MELRQGLRKIRAGEVAGVCLTVSTHVAAPGATCRLFGVSISLSGVVFLNYGGNGAAQSMMWGPDAGRLPAPSHPPQAAASKQAEAARQAAVAKQAIEAAEKVRLLGVVSAVSPRSSSYDFAFVLSLASSLGTSRARALVPRCTERESDRSVHPACRRSLDRAARDGSRAHPAGGLVE